MVIYYNLIQLRVKWKTSDWGKEQWTTQLNMEKMQKMSERQVFESNNIENGSMKMGEFMQRKLVQEVTGARFAMQ